MQDILSLRELRRAYALVIFTPKPSSTYTAEEWAGMWATFDLMHPPAEGYKRLADTDIKKEAALLLREANELQALIDWDEEING